MALDKLDFENWSSAGRDEAQSVNIEVSLSLLKEAEQQQQTIDSSIKILNILKDERRKFNASSKKKVSLKDLKNVFFDSEQTYPKESEYNKEEWGLASVNARLKNNLEKLEHQIEQNNKNYDEILNNVTNHIEDFLKKANENKSMI